MTNEERLKKLEADNEKLLKQVDLRDRLLRRVLIELNDPEVLCAECAYKDVCVNGATVEVCAAGMLLLEDARRQVTEGNEE